MFTSSLIDLALTKVFVSWQCRTAKVFLQNIKIFFHKTYFGRIYCVQKYLLHVPRILCFFVSLILYLFAVKNIYDVILVIDIQNFSNWNYANKLSIRKIKARFLKFILLFENVCCWLYAHINTYKHTN